MTKKDYIAFANIIRGYKNDPHYNGTTELIGQFAVQFADLFEQDNAQFDRGRFLKACGVKTDVGQ